MDESKMKGDCRSASFLESSGRPGSSGVSRVSIQSDEMSTLHTDQARSSLTSHQVYFGCQPPEQRDNLSQVAKMSILAKAMLKQG